MFGPDQRGGSRWGRTTEGAVTLSPMIPKPLLYAVGDVHGCCQSLQRLWRKIRADARARLGRGQKAKVVFLGDYIDRGPDSARVLGWCVRLQQKPPPWCEPVFLMGNHELMLLRFLTEPDLASLALWLINGGGVTLKSFGIAESTPAAVGRSLADTLTRRGLLTFLAGLPKCHRDGDWFFVHAGTRPGVALECQDPWDLLHIRDEFLDAVADHGARVVHGHTPTEDGRVEFRKNRIGIDTGAVFGGPLSAVRISGEAPRVLQVPGHDETPGTNTT